MEDIKLYEQILGITKPWKINEVKMDIPNERIDIYITYDSHTSICPKCNVECKLYDRLKPRVWRHLDSCQLKTYMHCAQPRIMCKTHGVKTITPPWAESNSRFTLFFECLAIRFLQQVKCQKRAATLLKISEAELSYIKEKAVKRGLIKREIKNISILGIDEKSTENGHNYASIIYNMSEKSVIDLCRGRDKNSVTMLVKEIFSKEARLDVKYFTVDMWKAYISVIKEQFSNAKIVHDKFHIMGYINDAVNKTRRNEHKKLLKINDTSLIKSKYLFLKNEENMTISQKEKFELLKHANYETSKVWALKETFKGYFECQRLKDADIFFKEWCNDVSDLENKYMTNVSKMLQRHYKNIRTYIWSRLTNALAESINAKIQEIKTIARGFYKFKNFRINILFHLGKLDLLPQTF